MDVKDLEVLAEYVGKDIEDPTLVARWAFDEKEGTIAYDSCSKSDGSVVGNPAWQPTGGKLGGALQFDGVDDCATAPYVVDPSTGPFSVFVWVRGGAPGQVILSQADGVNWLMAGDRGGVLATELRESGRKAKPLASQALITDSAWHRVGFVWDGTNRTLYVDDIEVARDTQASLAGSTGDLYIGTGSTMAAASLWKGLIDDVRIYNRAVKP